MAEIDPKQLEPGTQIATKSGTKLSIIKFLAFCTSMERGQAGKRPARADCEPSLHGRGQMERKKSPAPVVFVRPFGSRATPQAANAASSPFAKGEPFG